MKGNNLPKDEYTKQNPVNCKYSSVLQAIEQNNKFLGSLAYQMRTALNAITGFSEILSIDEPRDDQKDHLFEINRASKALTTLVNDVIEFTKIDSSLASKTRQCNLNEMVEEIKSIAGFKAELKGLDFEIAKNDDVAENIEINSRYLKDCIIRLADSVVKMANSGKVGINISSGENKTIKFQFYGDGIELDEEVKNELFEPFSVNLDKVYKDIEDTGLGFSIAAKLAEVLEASLYIPDDNSCVFVLNVPTTTSQEGRSKLVDEYIKSASKKRKFEPKVIEDRAKVLVAEDNISNQAVIRILLERLGCDVQMASNGKEAVEMADSNEFDMILMDVKMPEMDGYEATRIIREKGVCLPILALTAMDEAEVHDSSEGHNFDGHVSKPIDAKKMKTAISKFLIISQEKQKA